MGKRKYQHYAREFIEQAVKLVRESDKSMGAVAEMLGVSRQTLHRWKRQADIDEGRGPAEGLSTDEKYELRRLKREVKELQMALYLTKKYGLPSVAAKRSASSKRSGSDSE